MNVEEKINDFYQLHKNSGLFNDDLENVIYKLTNAYDYSFLKLIRDARTGNASFNKSDYEEFDELRHAYRACIKFAFDDCKHGIFLRNCNLDEIHAFQKEMKDTINFNHIRNIIDRYQLGRFSATLNEDIICFENIENERSLIFDAYSRNIGDNLPGSKNTKDTRDYLDFEFMIYKIAEQKPSFESKHLFRPKKTELKELIINLAKYYLNDYGVAVLKVKALDYLLFEYLLIYCYIVAIGMYKTAYLIAKRFDDNQTFQPSFLYPKEQLITDIYKTLDEEISEETIRKVLKDMTYDYDFHKQKITIYQPLFEVGDYLLASTNLMSHSYVVAKIIKFFDIKSTNKEDLSVYYNYMAQRMNHRMASNLTESYSDLQIYENCKLVINGLPQSEVDLVIFDNLSKTCALVELKNYSKVDNERDVNKKEEHINDAIQSRIIKDKRVVDHFSVFLKQNNIPKKYLNYPVSSLLITSSPTGGVGVKEAIKVVDEVLFYNLMNVYSGNLFETLKCIETESFYNLLKEKIPSKKLSYEYKGLRVEINYNFT